MPKISVLFPVYNTNETYLREAMESVLSQTFSDFEFIILNDASTDPNVEKTVKSYTDDRIRYYTNEHNLGISLTRNKLLDLANGEYLAIMDHDDISLPTRFEKQVAYLDSHPNVGVVGCKVKKIPENRVTRNPTNSDDIKLALMRSCAITHSACMIRSDVLKRNNLRYEEKFSPSEDYALFCRLIPLTDFYNIPEVLFLYRWHKTNTSKTQAARMTRCTYEIQSFAAHDNPVLHDIFMLTAENTIRVRLFHFLPIITIRRQGYRTKVYLFEKIPLLSYKNTIKLQEKDS